MALTQYNEWEPVLDPVNGVMQQEPRVFAHDARVITIGAINNSHSNHGITMTSGGTGYAVGMVIATTGSVTGSGAEVTVTAVDGGVITNYTVSDSGSGYLVGDNLTQSGASVPAGGLGFTCTVSNIDIPNTQKRGCCIYVGDISGGTRLDVVMEGGTAPIRFDGVVAGSFLPILVKRVDKATTATSLLALY